MIKIIYLENKVSINNLFKISLIQGGKKWLHKKSLSLNIPTKLMNSVIKTTIIQI